STPRPRTPSCCAWAFRTAPWRGSWPWRARRTGPGPPTARHNRRMSSSTPSTLGTDIAALRKSYERAELGEQASHADPLRQFDQWLGEAIAAQVPERNAMTLATVGSDLRPSTRIVLVKGYDARGIVWYTNYGSRKGRELAGNPYAALQFHWVELERVVRIEGVVQKVDGAES